MIYDEEICNDLGPAGAACFHTLVDKSRDVPPEDWARERVGQFCMTPASLAHIKIELEELCNSTTICTYEEQANLKAFFERVERIQAANIR